MRYLVSLLLGIVCGALIAAGFLYFNPAAQDALSPLAVSGQQQVVLNFSAVPGEAIVFTNDGESRTPPRPDKVSQLWEAPIRKTTVLVTALKDYRGSTVGIGVKISSMSEATRLLNNEAIVESAWHIVLPRQGTMQIGQTENHWNYLREIVVPAHWSAADNWKGNWRGMLSSGPNALGTARVFGGSGRYVGAELEAVEYLSTSAYSVRTGPVAADGQLIIELSQEQTRVAGSPDP